MIYAYMAAILFFLHIIHAAYPSFQFAPKPFFDAFEPSQSFFLVEWIKLVVKFLL